MLFSLVPTKSSLPVECTYSGAGRGINSTEVFNPEDGSITMGSPMNIGRFGHGIGLITIDDEDQLAVFFGGYDRAGKIDSVEVYNTKTGEWKITDITLKKHPDAGYLSLRLGDILPKL